MSLEELFYFVIGLMIIYMVYWQIYSDSYNEHKPIIPEPNGMLGYSKESALLGDWEKAAFGDEEE